jgi:8-oxo-dGTP pyrophosphatase MutT (NUDIX family)
MPPLAVRPRDAASLIIIRGRGTDAEVLLGRREPRSRFMPSVYVFPGGRVDKLDWAAPSKSELPASELERVGLRTTPSRARALGVTAVRETWEETGLVFGDLRDECLHPSLGLLEYVGRAITPASSPIRYHARFFMARADDAGGRLQGNGELIDLRWVPMREAGELPIIDVTGFMLEEAMARVGRATNGQRGRRKTLFLHYRREVPQRHYER